MHDSYGKIIQVRNLRHIRKGAQWGGGRGLSRVEHNVVGVVDCQVDIRCCDQDTLIARQMRQVSKQVTDAHHDVDAEQ